MLRKRDRAQTVEIKICGITNEEDALIALKCGAHALGFNLWPGSKRFIEIEGAADWIGQLPPGVRKVAVLVNPSRDDAIRTSSLPFIDSLQLHGNESPAFCRELADAGVSFTKAIGIRDETSLNQPLNFSTRSLLLDSMTKRGFGGTGVTFPWSLACRFVKDHPEFQVSLAGGLTAENVAEAIAAVRPFGVDVTSGVEAALGRKDPDRLQAFISAAARA